MIDYIYLQQGRVINGDFYRIESTITEVEL